MPCRWGSVSTYPSGFTTSRFTYFEESVQQHIVSRLAEAISTNGFLVVGRRESLPSGAPFVCDTPGLGIYRRVPVGGA